MRGEWFAGLAAVVVALFVARLAFRRPLIAGRARPLRTAELLLAGLTLVLLVFHCAAMFAPETVAALRVLDGPAARVRDLGDPVGRVAYWLPAGALVLALRRLWWPAPVALTVALAAVGSTMYHGSFTLTEHVVTIVVAGGGIALVLAGLVSRDQARPAGPSPSRPGG